MIIIIIGLIVLLVIGVVVVNGIQQHKQKQEQERRAQSAKFKAIVDESDELIANLGSLPPSPVLVTILNRRSLNAAKSIMQLSPGSKPAKQRVQELEAQLKASSEQASNGSSDENFVLPDNEQQLVGILQTIKKLRAMLKSEQAKGTLDAQTFSQQDIRLDGMQLKIGVESLVSRGEKAYSKEMLGSARQYFEKALQTLSNTAHPSEYTRTKKEQIEDQLEEITKTLANTNKEDAEKKAKDEEDDLDLLFQPKKKW